MIIQRPSGSVRLSAGILVLFDSAPSGLALAGGDFGVKWDAEVAEPAKASGTRSSSGEEQEE